MGERNHSQPSRSVIRACLLVGAVLGITQGVAAETTTRDLLRFAAKMAQQGNWREAKYRWELAERREADNPRVLNNLAVAHEALGDHDSAKTYYERALELGADEDNIRNNMRRFERLWEQIQRGETESSERESRSPAAWNKPPKAKSRVKTFKVPVRVPIPARLELEGTESLLVTSFRTHDSELLDINRELVRFLRSEYRKNTELSILEVVPAPAIPEQPIEDLLANHTFWKYLGREYDAELIVSGVVSYDRRDHSGFQNVDVVSPSTGQKVRQSRFVEQERFTYSMDIFFVDGATGTLRFRDRLQRSVIFRGSQNDPITAFFELSESLTPDVLAIVKPRMREDVRVIFKT